MPCPGAMPQPSAASSSRGSSYGTSALALKALSQAAIAPLSSSHPEATPSPNSTNDSHVARIVNGYVNSKFARGARGKTTVAYVGSKVDELERAAAHLNIACLPAIIARSRKLHGMPVTDPSLPSSSAAATAVGCYGPTVAYDRSLAPEGEWLPPYRASATAP